MEGIVSGGGIKYISVVGGMWKDRLENFKMFDDISSVIWKNSLIFISVRIYNDYDFVCFVVLRFLLCFNFFEFRIGIMKGEFVNMFGSGIV